jgi:sigma-B regulation protein RsbU (phosphoserine phosphatase)
MTQNLTSVERITSLNAALQEQFDAVARVQMALLPAAPPAVPGLSFAASYLPSGQAGGDYYDFFDLGPSRVGVLIADVSGHGPAAATVMAMLHAALHARPEVVVSPALALRFANTQLAATAIEGIHATALLAVIDSTDRTLTIARAGHPRPRLRHSSGQIVEPGDAGVPPLGIVGENFQPTESTTSLERGDTILLYTDGITEAESPTGEQFGLARLDQFLAANPASDPQSTLTTLRAAIAQHTASALREDDQTLVCISLAP